MYIKELRIFGFKRFNSFKIRLAEGMNVIVGDNDSGKSTVLEALVALTNGQYRGAPLSRCLSESLFNVNVVKTYVENVRAGTPCSPPVITIEAVFGGDEDVVALYMGDSNTSKTKESGITLHIALDSDSYSEEYQKYLESKACYGVPIEYYACTWTSFARKVLRPATIKYRSTLIGSANSSYWPGSRAYVSRIARDVLDEGDQISISQIHRRMRENFSNDETVVKINEKISTSTKSLTRESVSFGFEAGTLDSWETGIVTMLGGTSFSNVGDGTKSIVCTELALSKSEDLGKDIVLLEEPENHLSHTKLNMFLDGIKGRCSSTQLVVTTHSSFVANKLELRNLILLNGDSSASLSALAPDTSRFFMKAPGYKTLRALLCKVAMFVEGDADELIVQKAYMDAHDAKLPIQNGIDVISVGTSFLRFLEMAKAIGRPAIALTDNDGDIEVLKKKYASYDHVSHIAGDGECCQVVSYPERLLPDGEEENVNYNTLESEVYQSADKEILKIILEREVSNRDAAIKYMESNKTETALKIFDSELSIDYPPYIVEAIDWADGQAGVLEDV